MYKNQYLLLLRVQNRGRETYTLKALSDDGVTFEVSNKKIEFAGLDKETETIFHIYDPRITQIENDFYVMVAMDMEGKCSLGLIHTLDFETYTYMGNVGEGDIRNGVLFPEKIDGKYYRMDRPNKVALEGGVSSGNTIVLSESHDLLSWTPVKQLIAGRPHFWDERVGSGPPPVKTKEGWLHLYHGIADHFGSTSIYQGGCILLDLEDPSIVKARTRYNILEPREIWELAGQVPNVVFPSGMIVEQYDDNGFAELSSPVKVYYGAADTVVGLAESTIEELITVCYETNLLK
jgi:beta-1,4-mannooligosaccharide/beta-1,4-mannosyl-N-acetylglucosamine phosphorylase